MPSPLGHFLVGVTTHIATASPQEVGWRTRTAVTVACALAPDLDFLGGLWGVRWHQRHTHSIGAAVIAGAAVALVSLLGGGARRIHSGARTARWRSLGLAAFLGWTSHLAIDLLNVDTHPPIGIMALWPLSDAHFKFPWPIFMDIGRTLDWKTVRHDALALAWEAALLCPLLVVIWRGRTGRGR